MNEFLLQLLSGISASAVLFLVASGFTLVFGALRIINFAHGSVYMLGAFLATSISDFVGTGNVSFWISALLAGFSVAALGALIEIVCLRRIYHRDVAIQLLVTFGLVMIIGGLVRGIWGSAPRQTAMPPLFDGGVPMLGTYFPTYSLFLICVGSAAVIALWLIMYQTSLGRLIRGAVDDRQLLEMAGVNVPLLFTAVFSLGAFFAGIAGALVTPQQTISVGLDLDVIVKAVVVVVIGGLGSIGGALVGSLMVGVASSIALIWLPPSWSLIVVFGLLVTVLAISPQGLFGKVR
ncbi:branched-chain amino acid ABC transporter permease [Aminobacter sp. SR38]|jgi:branched-subunit amino acid ABC-type transport system permease component|uniref:branched-chain amino acid ABC transporter permease n=1 Tax=unclassified Aminobacter TaxID=2644704 RepID=UPI00177EAFD9|nr:MULTISPECIES: branched-chain amino acid ABC transporter permease [unclassified Aminobacter]MCX8571054.1 branched-chain amino acid ABC transporter permease [Aminobacter sp. MET-1]QOF70805.1 branched-chain amino acid ABC transporter permease [Aminobacter sp. SR38]